LKFPSEATSINGVRIRLTEERWEHIASRHPELRLYVDKVLETIEHPDFVARGFLGEFKAVRLYLVLPIGQKYLIVAYREIDRRNGFIITARFGSDIGDLIRGGVVWRRKS
jgi:hypothetical protein